MQGNCGTLHRRVSLRSITPMGETARPRGDRRSPLRAGSPLLIEEDDLDAVVAAAVLAAGNLLSAALAGGHDPLAVDPA